MLPGSYMHHPLVLHGHISLGCLAHSSVMMLIVGIMLRSPRSSPAKDVEEGHCATQRKIIGQVRC